jgi:hypothetical protein
MSVIVSTTNNNKVSVVQGNQTGASVVVKRADNLTVQGLSNVQSTDLQDGYTLVYDSTTNKWITQQISGAAINAVDGGTY